MARVKWPGTGDSTRVQQGDKSREHRVSDEAFEQEVDCMIIPFGLLDRTDSEQLHASRFHQEQGDAMRELARVSPHKGRYVLRPGLLQPLICPSTIFSGRDPVL